MSTSGSGSDSEWKQHSPSSSDSSNNLIGATASPSPVPPESNVGHKDKKLRQIRKRLREVDWLWLNACQGIVDGDVNAMEAYLAANGDASRALTAEECTVLNRSSAFQVGYTLIHLAVRFQREDMLAALLTTTDVSKAKKRVPSHAAPDVAAEILRDVATFIRKRKGDFPCYFLTEMATFALPAGN
jgi:ubiquitin thioesterase ZRANB1